MTDLIDSGIFATLVAQALDIDRQQVVDALAAAKPTTAQKKLVAYRTVVKTACLGLAYHMRPSALARKMRLPIAEVNKISSLYTNYFSALAAGGRAKDSN